MKNGIKKMPENERPYEKCLSYGADCLTDSELLAVLLRSGTKNKSALDISRDILANTDNNLLGLINMSYEELISMEGIGKVKAIQLLCLLQLSKRISQRKVEKYLDFSDSKTVAEYYMEDMRHKNVEYLKAVFLDCKNIRIKDYIVTKGTINYTIASPRDVFSEGLKCSAARVIIIHNHPSGDPRPSKQDIEITKSFKEIGDMIGIKLCDHIIIGDNCYYSFSENSYL